MNHGDDECDDMTDALVPGRSSDGTFPKGVSGNPRGRPAGARAKLADTFARDLLAAWEAKGAETIETFRAERPHDFVKLVASLLPKHFNLKVHDELDELTDEQLDRRIAALAAALDEAGACAGHGGEGSAPAPQPPLLLPALSQAG